VKTGVQKVLNTLKILDSGFRRNDRNRGNSNFFTPSPLKGEENPFLISLCSPSPLEGEGRVRGIISIFSHLPPSEGEG
jgi:hypothetical protein